MAYGTVKVDSITFTNGGVDQTITVSGIVQSISGDITATGTIQAATIIGTSTVSGATVTGDSGQYGNLNSVSGVFTTQISGTTITGDSGQYATLTGISGVFTTAISGATITGDAGNYSELTAISGVFTTQISGATITGNTIQASTVTGISGVYTTQLSGATVTGDTGSFTTVTGGVATITSGVFALGTNALPSISFSSDPDTGIYSPGADQVAISTNGTGKLFVNNVGNTSINTSNPVGNSSSVYLTVNGSTLGGIALKSNDTTVGYLQGESTLIRLSSDGAKAITFDTNGSERLRITSNGELKHIGGGSEGDPAVYFAGSAPAKSLVIDSSGRLLVGTASARSDISGANSPQLQIESVGTDAASSYRSALSIIKNGADVRPAYLILGKSRGASLGSDGLVSNGDILGEITFVGSDGSELEKGATVQAVVDGTPGANDLPTRLVFSVTESGNSSPTEALRISNDRSITVSDGGNIVVGTTTGTKIGTATSQKIGFFDTTPVVQPTTGVAEAAFVENSGGTAVNVDSTFGGYTLQQVVQALQNLGILA